MAASPPAQPFLPALPHRKRTQMACLHCRKRRIRCVTDGTEGSRCERCAQKELDCEYVPVNEERDKPLVVTNPEGKAKRSPPPTSSAHPGIATQPYPHEYRSSSSTYVSSSRSRTQQTPSPFYPARGLLISKHHVPPVDHSPSMVSHSTSLANPPYTYATPPTQFHTATNRQPFDTARTHEYYHSRSNAPGYQTQCQFCGYYGRCDCARQRASR
ncbi:hypothetical protein C8R47DRAFT_1088129 [Mycena vitilis]|nr:hypothetical protein C8R47DRAFT_1088129 [Mycena vitilis]